MTDLKTQEPSEAKRYDFGIVGVWYGENYGSVLTYYALYTSVSRAGYSVAMIDKMGSSAADSESKRDIHPRRFAAEHGYNIIPAISFDRLDRLNEYCDGFIVGSDQVWNRGISRETQFGFYLNFAHDNKKKIAYASSFGHNISFTGMDEISAITTFLHRFDAISVREAQGVTILKNEFGAEGTQVLDPVFLLNRADYEELASAYEGPFPKKPYLLAYVLDPEPGTKECLERLARERGLDIVALLDGRGDFEQNKAKLGIDGAIRCVDVNQWLKFIQNASFVVTDSFHGSCFSLMFNKQFFSIGNRRRGISRFHSFVDTFGLHDRLITSVSELANAIQKCNNIDYACVRSILEAERTRSRRWLVEALAAEHKVASNITRVPNKECCGCGSCFNVCPFNAISMQYDEEGFLYPRVDSGLCVNCGKCVKSCPSLAPHYEKKSEPKVYAAYTDNPVRMESSSGGIFSLVANWVLSMGGVICGAAFDENLVLRHRVISCSHDLGPLRQSKYVQSDTGRTYVEVKQALDAGSPALYVGCPCQIAGLNSFLGREYPNLYTIDLLCHGGPSPVAFRKYLQEIHGDKEITYLSFRDKKDFGWSTEMAVDYADGSKYRELRSSDPFYRAFLPCLSVRPHCQVCNYARLPRQGDITLGDFWGVSKYDKSLSDGNGTSIVSVNSSKGDRIMSAIRPLLAVDAEIDRDYVLSHGQPYGRPYKNNPLRYRFLRMLVDLPFEKTLLCCENNDFDFGLIGLNADSRLGILEHYALYKSLARYGCTVLLVKRPKEFRSDSILRHRFVAFSNRHYPTVSAHDTVKGYRRLDETCHGYISYGNEGLPNHFTRNKRGVFNCANLFKVSPIFLLGRDDYISLCQQSSLKSDLQYVAIQLKDNRKKDRAVSLIKSEGLDFVDLSSDMDIEEWIATLACAKMVISDVKDDIEMSILLGTPIVVCDSASDLASKLGIPNHVCNGDLHLAMRYAIEHPVDVERFRDKANKTFSVIEGKLPSFRSKTKCMEIPDGPIQIIKNSTKDLRKLARKIRRRAGKIKRRVFR